MIAVFFAMVNSFYKPGEERGKRVGDLFAKIAPRYDLINDLQSFGLHRYWKKRLIQIAKINPGERALDVCCGTGDISFALAGSGAEVTGIDFSQPMLSVADSKIQSWKPEAGSPKFVQGDAQNLPFADSSFDVVTVGYGLRNLPNWERGLEEIFRVAKPGARILVLDFGKPDNTLWRKIYFSYLRWFVPIFGKLFCGDSATHAYILESLENVSVCCGIAAEKFSENRDEPAQIAEINFSAAIPQHTLTFWSHSKIIPRNAASLKRCRN